MPRSLACSISRYAIPSYFALNTPWYTDAFLELSLSLRRSIIDVLGLIGQSQARRVGEEVVDWPNRGAEGIRAAGGEAEGETWIYGIGRLWKDECKGGIDTRPCGMGGITERDA